MDTLILHLTEPGRNQAAPFSVLAVAAERHAACVGNMRRAAAALAHKLDLLGPRLHGPLGAQTDTDLHRLTMYAAVRDFDCPPAMLAAAAAVILHWESRLPVPVVTVKCGDIQEVRCDSFTDTRTAYTLTVDVGQGLAGAVTCSCPGFGFLAHRAGGRVELHDTAHQCRHALLTVDALLQDGHVAGAAMHAPGAMLPVPPLSAEEQADFEAALSGPAHGPLCDCQSTAEAVA